MTVAYADLSAERVARELQTSRYGRLLEVKASTESTNDDARAAAQAGAPDGYVVVADAQTRGRGSRGRPWLSPAGTDLYLSLVARVRTAPPSLPPVTLAVGVAVAETLEAFLPAGQRAHVKWPNDVWLHRKKCAGILVEGASSGELIHSLVIGIGVNVNRRVFPDGLETPPTSLSLAVGHNVNRSDLLAALLGSLEHWVDRFVEHGAAPIVSAVEERLALRDEAARCDEISGTVVGIASSGALCMRTDSGVVEALAGTLRPLHP